MWSLYIWDVEVIGGGWGWWSTWLTNWINWTPLTSWTVSSSWTDVTIPEWAELLLVYDSFYYYNEYYYVPLLVSINQLKESTNYIVPYWGNNIHGYPKIKYVNNKIRIWKTWSCSYFIF